MSGDEKLVYRIEARGRALSSAEKINPAITSYNQQAGISGQRSVITPTTETVLKDAETIYEWLVKDLN